MRIKSLFKMGIWRSIDMKYKSKVAPHVETVVLLSRKTPDAAINKKRCDTRFWV